MARLRDRIAALERQLAESNKPSVVIRKVFSPGELTSEMTRLRAGSREWLRQSDESENSFVARVANDAGHGTRLIAD